MTPTEKLLLKPAEVSATLGLSRTKTYALIASGGLPSVRIGRSVRVPNAALQAWIEQQTSTDNEQS
jgi:excisionase family DNA binding protein